ncbi:hypothetical protein BLNAU_18562 [Blattamonas nauphoetae]|uniref:Uncharacterized protein n=1 Tax=Blattamonas nauphoetae TaxID=2049346 RepID=A0ABQ9X420_9EUKA|nr:hypothetical protein BLNAU_18562 [Blattamonas nauphoetae]
MNVSFLGENDNGVLQGGGTLTFLSAATAPIDVLFEYMKIWSYHVVDNEWQTYIIACLDDTTVEFRNSVIADYASMIDFPLPDRYSLVCIWDGQMASVRIANTKCKIPNTTFDGICLGGLSLRNVLPWTEPAAGENAVLLELDKFMFRGNRWPQPTTDGIRAYVPYRNLFVLSESKKTEHIIIHAGEDGFDGGKDLSEPLEIYYRGVVLLTDVNETGTLVPFTPPRTAPTFDKIEITATRGTSSETTLVTIAITGTNLYRCGSNTLNISPYFNGEVPVNPTWREVPITRATGMTEIVAEAKSSDLWPAGKWVVRVTIAAVNYVHYDVVGVGSESVVPILAALATAFLLLF